ncbi:patatin-like phospholipase family protein [Bradyrhizobium yuanmingense]|uniref:patatin-like phospholipase family protein n=1 Tax=Bradyrhizobium yuanmingense TaxID=108015 RepID=UPI0035130B54
MERDAVLIDLALQGGGSHGAFSWGVLDRLLEEKWLEIAAISGTSAGAMNAAVLADGWTAGGAEGAREALDRYWRRISKGRGLQPATALSARPLDGALDPRYVAVLHPHRFDVACALALRPQSYRLQSAARGAGREHRFRTARALADPAIHHRDPGTHRARTYLPQRGDHGRRAAGIGLSSNHVPRD